MEKINCLLVGGYLLAMAVMDWRVKTIPVIPGVVCMVVIVLLQILSGRAWGEWLPGIAIGVFLYVVNRASRGKIGAGDALVYVVTGLALGFVKNLELLMVSLLFAAAAALVLIVMRHAGRNDTIPFIPFTAAAFGVVVFL